MSESYITVELNQQPIELCKLLKIANLVSGGGEAKIVISEGYVYLNGEVEYQKRKKVYHQDVIEFNGDSIQIIINEDLNEAIESPSLSSNHSHSQVDFPINKKSKNKSLPANDKVKDEYKTKPNVSKRRPISF